jgi:hypothetical protein
MGTIFWLPLAFHSVLGTLCSCLVPAMLRCSRFKYLTLPTTGVASEPTGLKVVPAALRSFSAQCRERIDMDEWCPLCDLPIIGVALIWSVNARTVRLPARRLLAIRAHGLQHEDVATAIRKSRSPIFW